MNAKVCLSLVVVLFYSFSSIARAGDVEYAKKEANIMMDEISQGNYRSVWDNHMSQWFKAKLTKDSFLANLTLGRSMLGARVGSKLIDVSYTTSDPQSGYQGDIYAFTYKNKYQVGSFYERVAVINEDGSGFKLAGFFANPTE